MDLNEFYTKFLDALNNLDVEYLVVGGQAVNFHGYSRATLDLNVWIGKSQKNLLQLEKAFISMGYEEVKASEAVDYYAKNHKINIPKNNNLIEVLDDGILKSDFYEAYNKKARGKIEETHFFVIDLDTLLEIKSRSNRMLDKNDAEMLRQINSNDEVSDDEPGYTLE